MAVTWRWSQKMGELTIKQSEGEYTINIYAGNCLGVFLYEYQENGKDMYRMYNFFLDKQHLTKVLKEYGINKQWQKIRLNLFYKDAETMLKIFAKYELPCEAYYQEPTDK